MHTVKYILVQIETIAMLISFILGIGAAESSMWWSAILLLFGPFLYGHIVNFSKHVDYCEIYNRACRIKSFK